MTYAEWITFIATEAASQVSSQNNSQVTGITITSIGLDQEHEGILLVSLSDGSSLYLMNAIYKDKNGTVYNDSDHLLDQGIGGIE